MEKRPVRFFNTTGPCNPRDHYMLPPEDRLVGAQLHRYIKDKLYWILHAPRQTGKTDPLLSESEVLARQMTTGPQDAIPEPEWQWEKPDGSLDKEQPWDERLSWEVENGITVVRC